MDLNGKRFEIDRIDEKIVGLLGRRAEIAIEIGREKKANGKSLQDAEREEDVLQRIGELNKGPMSDLALLSIYRAIISACLDLQKRDT